MAEAGYVIRDVAAAGVRKAQIVVQASEVNGAEARNDDIGVLMSSFSRMLATIEDQDGQINAFAAQLEAAYNKLEATNGRLKELSFTSDTHCLWSYSISTTFTRSMMSWDTQ